MARRPQNIEKTEVAKEATNEEKRVHEEALLAQAADLRKEVISKTEDAEREVLTLSSHIDTLRVEISVLKDSKKKAEIEYGEVSNKLSSLKEKHDNLKEDIAYLIHSIEDKKAQSQKDLASLHAGYDKTASEYSLQINSLNNKTIEALKSFKAVQKDIEETSKLKEKIEKTISEKQNILAGLENKISSISKELDGLQSKIEELETLKKNVEKKEAELERLNILINQARETHTAVIEETNKKKAELDEKIRINSLVESSIDVKTAKIKHLIDRAQVLGIVKEKII